MENEQPEIIRLFRGWLNNLFQTSEEDWDIDTINEEIGNLMEVKVMFETALKERDKKMIEQGIEQDRLAIAKKMKEEGLDNELIARITDLSIDEITKL